MCFFELLAGSILDNVRTVRLTEGLIICEELSGRTGWGGQIVMREGGAKRAINLQIDSLDLRGRISLEDSYHHSLT